MCGPGPRVWLASARLFALPSGAPGGVCNRKEINVCVSRFARLEARAVSYSMILRSARPSSRSCFQFRSHRAAHRPARERAGVERARASRPNGPIVWLRSVGAAGPTYRSPLRSPGKPWTTAPARATCIAQHGHTHITHTHHLRLGSALCVPPTPPWRGGCPKDADPRQPQSAILAQGHIRTAHAASRPHSLCRPEKVPSTQYSVHGSLRRTAGAPLP